MACLMAARPLRVRLAWPAAAEHQCKRPRVRAAQAVPDQVQLPRHVRNLGLHALQSPLVVLLVTLGEVAIQLHADTMRRRRRTDGACTT